MLNLLECNHLWALEKMAARYADFEPLARRYNEITQDRLFSSVDSGISRAMRAKNASHDGLLISLVLTREIPVGKPLLPVMP
jgi:hypothetical protein